MDTGNLPADQLDMVLYNSESKMMRLMPKPQWLYQQIGQPPKIPANEREKIKEILGNYGLSLTGDIFTSRDSGRSGLFVVESSLGKKVLKSYKYTVNLQTVIHEHSILLYLAQLDFPSPRLVLTQKDESLVSQDGEIYALFDYMDGYFQYHNFFVLPSTKLEFIHIAGKVLNKLHTALSTFTPNGYNPEGFKSRTGERWREITWYIDKFSRSIEEPFEIKNNQAREMVRLIDKYGSWAEKKLTILDNKLDAVSLPRLIIHNDYGPYNLFFKPGSQVVILDFELASLDWRIIDFSKAFQYFCRNRFGFSQKKLKTFIDGYQSESRLSKHEMNLIPDAWLHLLLRRFMVISSRYLQKPEDQYYLEARRIIKLSHWVIDNSQNLANL